MDLNIIVDATSFSFYTPLLISNSTLNHTSHLTPIYLSLCPSIPPSDPILYPLITKAFFLSFPFLSFFTLFHSSILSTNTYIPYLSFLHFFFSIMSAGLWVMSLSCGNYEEGETGIRDSGFRI